MLILIFNDNLELVIITVKYWMIFLRVIHLKCQLFLLKSTVVLFCPLADKMKAVRAMETMALIGYVTTLAIYAFWCGKRLKRVKFMAVACAFLTGIVFNFDNCFCIHE